MQYAELTGTHYDAGYRFGLNLSARKFNILDNLPYRITPERLAFSAACIPLYRAFYPRLFDELQGIADAQSADISLIQALLFSMYAMPPMCACSCFAYSDGQEIIFARNSDFFLALEENNLNVLYRFSDGGFAFSGNTTAFTEIEDGVNEHGLAIGMTAVFPREIKPGFNAGLLVRYLLETCRTVSEALAALKRLPIASAQTITLADVSGDIALVECDCSGMEVIRPTASVPFVCAVNAFHSPAMSRAAPLALDDWFSAERCHTMRTALSSRRCSAEYAQRLLRGEFGFLCQYERTSGRATVWSVVCDLKRRRLFRADGDPSVTPFIPDTHLIF